MDVPSEQTLFILGDDGRPIGNDHELWISNRSIEIQRLKDRRPSTVEAMLAAAREIGHPLPSHPSAWITEAVPGPNITDKSTVLSLAEMAANAYAFNETDLDWHDIGGQFNRSNDFGWQGDGLRGHIYANEDNSTIVIGIKGTTPG
jgi:lipase ATG15